MQKLPEPLFKQLTDALPFGVCILDPGRKFQYCNREAEAITGRLRQEILGHACAEVLRHCDASGAATCDSLHCPTVSVIATGATTEQRLFLTHKQGHRIPVVVRTIPLPSQNGEIAAIAEIFQQEKANPEDLSWVDEAETRMDPALGIYSEATTQKQLRSALATSAPIAAFLIEIADLAEMGKHRGSEMVRFAQRAVVRTIIRLLNTPHYLGRWSQNRFVVLIPACGRDTFAESQGKLSRIRNSCSVTWWGDRIELSVFVTGALSEAGDSMETFIGRLQPPSGNTGMENE